jgi:hypothetical protein
LPVYIPEKTQVTIVNDTPSEQTKKQETLLEYLKTELETLKGKQVTTEEASASHSQLMKSLEGQIETLTTSLSGAPSQKTIEQQTAIDFLKAELAKLKESGPAIIAAPVAPDTSAQDALIAALADNFKKLTDIVDTKNETREASPQTVAQQALIEDLQTKLSSLQSTSSASTVEALKAQQATIKILEEKIASIIIPDVGEPSDLTKQQQDAIVALQTELASLKTSSTSIDSQASILTTLADNFTKLTDLVDTKNADKEPSAQTVAQQTLIDELQAKLNNLEDTDSSDSTATLQAQQDLITALEQKISEIIIPETGEPSDLTKQQEATITLLKQELVDLRSEVKGDLVGSLNNQIDSLTTLIGNNLAQGTSNGTQEIVVQDSSTQDLLKYLKDDLV